MAAVEVLLGECIFSLCYNIKLISIFYFPKSLGPENSEYGLQNVIFSINSKLQLKTKYDSPGVLKNTRS